MTTMQTIEVTEVDRNYIRRAKAHGQKLHQDGVVSLDENVAAVRDGGRTYHADAHDCECSTSEERNEHACEHMWAGHFAGEQAAATAREKAA